jgi:hypothetical protein
MRERLKLCRGPLDSLGNNLIQSRSSSHRHTCLRVLFDPPEEQLHLLACSVQFSDREGRKLGMVVEKGQLELLAEVRVLNVEQPAGCSREVFLG